MGLGDTMMYGIVKHSTLIADVQQEARGKRQKINTILVIQEKTCKRIPVF